jgi:hypothetical protein
MIETRSWQAEPKPLDRHTVSFSFVQYSNLFRILCFEFVSGFVFRVSSLLRASCFEFRISGSGGLLLIAAGLLVAPGRGLDLIITPGGRGRPLTPPWLIDRRLSRRSWLLRRWGWRTCRVRLLLDIGRLARPQGSQGVGIQLVRRRRVLLGQVAAVLGRVGLHDSGCPGDPDKTHPQK